MSVIRDAWFRKKHCPDPSGNETHQDINPAHLNIHASNFNVLRLFTIV